MEKTTIETQREIENAVALYVEAVLAKSKLEEEGGSYVNGYARVTGGLESLVSLAVSKMSEENTQQFLAGIRNRLNDRQRDIYKTINNRVTA